MPYKPIGCEEPEDYPEMYEMRKRKIYLACPYSHEDEAVRLYRVEQATRVAARLVEKGYIVFSPLTHSHPIADHMDNHLDHDTWLEQDFAFIDWSDELWVLMLEGHQDSVGVNKEIAYASRKNKVILFIRAVDEIKAQPRGDYGISRVFEV